MKNFRILAVLLLVALYGSHHAKAAGPLSLFFEENHGQGPAEARFLARGQGYNIVLAPEGNQVVLHHAGRGLSMSTRLVDANPKAVIRGEEKQAGKVHYLRAGSSLTDIPTYARVRYESAYPGIDLVYYGSRQQLEYDFVVSPGADPIRIALRFEGVESVTVDPEGNLVLRTADSEIVQHKPMVYQSIRNRRQEIAGAYHLLDAKTVAFNVGPYDHKAALVIDPILSYSTFLGGSNGDDDARAVTTDSAGNLYIAGSTTSTNFQTAFALQPSSKSLDPASGLSDAFVTKLNPSGTALIYSTYFGGSNDDDANAIAVDATGGVVIAGTTSSTDFPTESALRRTCNGGPSGCSDAFVARLTASGSGLAFSTYLGGSGDDDARGVALDPSGNAYITGKTDSPDFPTTFGAYSLDPAAGGFVTKLGFGGILLYSTYFGTIFGPADPRAIAVDSSGNAYITGSFSTPGSSTAIDAFIGKLLPTGSGLAYMQFVRGSKDETGNAIALDSSGNVYVAGQTSSMNFQTTANAVQSRFSGPAFRTSDSGSNWNVTSNGLTRTSLYALSSSGSTMFAGADDDTFGGVFKSTDGGINWTSASTGISDARVHALAIDPSVPATVYAGSRTLGVFKSTNGGGTWSATPLNNVFVTALAADPGSSGTIYAGTDSNGIYKSTNSGASWAIINSGLASSSVRSIVVDPSSNTTVYAATAVGIYKSTNGGASWASSSSGLFDPNINALAADPGNPGVLYAGTNSVGVFRSANSGGLWVPANGGFTGSALSVTALTVDPGSGTVYGAVGESNAVRVYKSSNGTTWTLTSLATSRLTAFALDRSSAGTVVAATVGGTDGFVAKWNASGSLSYATYLGGSRNDTANAVAADSSGGIYVAGSTSSTNFPLANPLQSAFGGGSDVVSDAFAAKLNSSGSFEFSTYLGGSGNDFGKGIAIDSSNAAFVVGVTASSDFPTAAALVGTRLGLLDAFVVKIGEGTATAFAVPQRGGFSATSLGGSPNTAVGYARIQTLSGALNPSALAIFGFRQNNVLVSEAAVPASTLITQGRIYAEVGGAVNTGIAIANPNPVPATITYYFTDRNGQTFGQGTSPIPANGQVAKFLNQDPFNGGASLFGTFSFVSSQPVAVIALRGFTNERGEFLLTTLPVSNLSVSDGFDSIFFPHFADGGGWVTQILLVNTTDGSMFGTIQFAGLPSRDYSIPGRSAVKIATDGISPGTLTGSARVVPSPGTPIPSGVAVFSFKNAGITVTEAGVQASRPGTAFRLYAESSGVSGQTGSIQTGIAVANPSNTSTQLTFELTTITGVTTGLVSTQSMPANGQLALFLEQIPGFTQLPNPFQGVLRVSASGGVAISVVGLRGRYNERKDFLITTTPPTNEASGVSASEQFFPHFADGGGYTTQFILYNGSTDQSSSGLIRFFGQSGQTLSLGVR